MPDPERTRLASILAELCQAVGADGGGAVYLDDGDGTLQLAAWTEAERNTGVVDRLLGRGLEATGAELVLRLGGNGGGMAVLRRRARIDFTQQDRAVARLYARRLADGKLVEPGPLSKSGWTRQLESIQRIAARLTRLASVDEVATTMCNEISQLIDHDEAHVLIVDDGGILKPVASIGRDGAADLPPLPADGPGGVEIGRALRSGMPTLAPKIASMGALRNGPHSMLVVPLHYESRVSGLICLIARGAHRFDDDDLRLIQILSDQAAVAIENARLLQGRDELVHELAGMLEISQAAGSAQDEGPLAALLASRLLRLTRMDGAVVARWEEGSTVMRAVARDGMSGDAKTIDVTDSPGRRQALREGKPVVIQADDTEYGTESTELHLIGAQTLLLLPLNAGGRTIGLIEMVSRSERRVPGTAEIQACEAMASLAATGMEKVQVLQQLRDAADIDLVSGVHNHRYLQERLRQEIARSARSHAPLAVLMLDLDKFKPINDKHGHADGDRVLRNIAATISAHVRSNDIVARYGGDEFVVVMPDTPSDRAEQVARRVVGGVLQQQHELTDRSRVTVGVSAGLSFYPHDGRNSAQLLQAADAAMYEAKRGGGRQVELSSHPTTKSGEHQDPRPARAAA
ncbi:MAG TPA: diguanylate cyclase [Candidatus Limnocylindrales bacterium]